MIGMSIYSIIMHPNNSPSQWTFLIGTIIASLIGAYASFKLFPKEVLYESNRLARMAKLFNK